MNQIENQMPPDSALESVITTDASALPVSSQMRPNVGEVRRQVPLESVPVSTALGIVVFCVAWCLYLGAIACAIVAPWWPLQLASGILAGSFIGTVFIVGHDACHGSLTSSYLLNRILARLAFLPSLTPYTSWEYTHNRIHHSFTNLRERDYVWAPYSKAEYDNLSTFRRAIERHYRSILGFTPYYIIEIWWKHLLFPSAQERQEMKHAGVLIFDRLLVFAFAAMQITLAISTAAKLTPGEGFWGAWNSPVGLVFMTVLVPFDIWCWGMAFAIFQHHSHSRAAWFKDRSEWDYFAAQVENAVHMQMPNVFEWISASIMQHTAHHANPRIPLYRLRRAQAQLEAVYPSNVIVERWSFERFVNQLKTCRLYDYQQHRWLDYSGKPTTEPNPIIGRLRSAPAANCGTDSMMGAERH